MKFTEIKEDLFTSPETSCIAHCVSKNLKMGMGIAPKIINKFGGRSELLDQKLDIGDCGVVRNGNRFIYHLVTKDMHYDKPTLETIKMSLINMRNHMMKHNMNELCIPTLGCGLDKMNWIDVKNEIINIFKETNISITVYLYK